MLKGTAVLILGGVVPPAASAQQVMAAAPLVFNGVTVVDVEQGKLVPDQRVVIVGNRIQAVGEARGGKLPKGAQVIDARGKYLIPGLWDAHVHPMHQATDVFYPLLVANGVTGIRDAGSTMPLDSLIQWRREIAAGTRVGPPHQILNGPSLNACPEDSPAPPPAICVDSTSARHLVDSLQAAGADMIKSREVDLTTYFAIASEARRIGIPFGGHISWSAVREGITYLQASDSGARIIDHDPMRVTTVFNCWGPTGTVEDCRPVVERFRRNGTWWDPTLVTYAAGFGGLTAIDARGSRVYEQFARRIARFWGDSLRRGTEASTDDPAPEGDPATDSVSYGAVVQRADMPMLAGTDAAPQSLRTVTPGFALHAELALYVAEGLTTLNALQSATINPAKMWHSTDSLGTVAPGKLADLVLLDANPLADITNTTTIRAVVANGRYFDRAMLDQMLIEVRAKAKEIGQGREP